jgi:CHAD domain-containing protein
MRALPIINFLFLSAFLSAIFPDKKTKTISRFAKNASVNKPPMAKTYIIPHLNETMLAGNCLDRLIGYRLREIEVCLPGVIEGSVDAVHDMRVGCRRLRALFYAFRAAFQKKKIKKFKRTMRALTGLLGAVREYDVLIEQIRKNVRPTTVSQREALGLLTSRYLLLRNQAHDALAAALKKIDLPAALAGFRQQMPLIFKEKALGAVTFASFLRRVVPQYGADFISSSRMVAWHPRRFEALHRLRIDGKPLRYIMELSSVCFGDIYKRYYLQIKDAIALLGDIHDLDVTIATLCTYLREVRLFNTIAKASGEKPMRPGFLLTTIASLREKRNADFIALSTTLDQWRIKRLDEKFATCMRRCK